MKLYGILFLMLLISCNDKPKIADVQRYTNYCEEVSDSFNSKNFRYDEENGEWVCLVYLKNRNLPVFFYKEDLFTLARYLQFIKLYK